MLVTTKKIGILIMLCLIFNIHIKHGIIREPNIVKVFTLGDSILTDSTNYYLKEALKYYNVKYPNIVYAQALLETGHFTSFVYKNYNNLFGLYDSRLKDYHNFEHWTESVKGYKNLVQFKYKGGNYYHFLDSIGYAEDPAYIFKLKAIVQRIKDKEKRKLTIYDNTN